MELDDVAEKTPTEDGHAVNADTEMKKEPTVHIEIKNKQTKVDFDNIP